MGSATESRQEKFERLLAIAVNTPIVTMRELKCTSSVNFKGSGVRPSIQSMMQPQTRYRRLNDCGLPEVREDGTILYKKVDLDKKAFEQAREKWLKGELLNEPKLLRTAKGLIYYFSLEGLDELMKKSIEASHKIHLNMDMIRSIETAFQSFDTSVLEWGGLSDYKHHKVRIPAMFKVPRIMAEPVLKGLLGDTPVPPGYERITENMKALIQDLTNRERVVEQFNRLTNSYVKLLGGENIPSPMQAKFCPSVFDSKYMHYPVTQMGLDSDDGLTAAYDYIYTLAYAQKGKVREELLRMVEGSTYKEVPLIEQVPQRPCIGYNAYRAAKGYSVSNVFKVGGITVSVKEGEFVMENGVIVSKGKFLAAAKGGSCLIDTTGDFANLTILGGSVSVERDAEVFAGMVLTRQGLVGETVEGPGFIRGAYSPHVHDSGITVVKELILHDNLRHAAFITPDGGTAIVGKGIIYPNYNRRLPSGLVLPLDVNIESTFGKRIEALISVYDPIDLIREEKPPVLVDLSKLFTFTLPKAEKIESIKRANGAKVITSLLIKIAEIGGKVGEFSDPIVIKTGGEIVAIDESEYYGLTEYPTSVLINNYYFRTNVKNVDTFSLSMKLSEVAGMVRVVRKNTAAELTKLTSNMKRKISDMENEFLDDSSDDENDGENEKRVNLDYYPEEGEILSDEDEEDI